MAQIRTFLVTGSNQGLGKHTVHQLASTPNVVVFMGSRKIAAAEEALAGFAPDIHASSTVVPLQLDITDDASIKAAYTTISEYLKAKNLSGLDVLINNAAVAVPSFRECYEVNVFGTVTLTETLFPLINPNGTILNISSGMGSHALRPLMPDLPAAPAYSSSKSALNQLTKSGIRVISICPGFNATKLNGFTGTMAPEDGAKIIVSSALEKDGRTGVFIHKDGDYPW
ncbi:hypothetical protein B0H17DRAFT_1100007 [Mycena rosella]|uniref:NAD(P)-binding protein n=1 Tax=Mycena rosella TaxID=1033263 RepID=A0AAD7CN24_MYCRO|nr:hypothetical protein B0H17DRAFT_1100007 [Mycena rosella]